MTALADDFTRLIGALHSTDSDNDFPEELRRCIREGQARVNAVARRMSAGGAGPIALALLALAPIAYKFWRRGRPTLVRPKPGGAE
jgi:hypothetical protein